MQPSGDYKGYKLLRERMAALSLETLIRDGSAWVGSPSELREQILRFNEECGGFDYASLQVNFHHLPFTEAMRSLTLFAEQVIPFVTPAGTASVH